MSNKSDTAVANGHAANIPEMTEAEAQALAAAQEPEKVPEAPKAEEAEAQEEAAAQAAVVDEIPAPPPTPFTPVYDAEARDYATEIGEINKRLGEIRTAMREGDMDEDAYEAEFESLQEKRAQLRIEQAMAEGRAEMSRQAADQAWTYLQNQFFADPANAQIRSSAGIFAAWEAEMQALVNEASQEGRQITDWEIMHGARQRLVAQGFPLTGNAPRQAVSQQDAVTPSQPPPSRTPRMSEVPATLGSAPSMASVGGRASAEEMASMGIEDIEDRLARMGDDQRDALLRGTPGAFVD